FHLRVPAGGGAVVVDHRAGAVLLQLLVDLPHEALALFRIGFHRLPVEFLLELAIAIAGVVALRAARKILVEGLIRILQPVSCRLSPMMKSLRMTLGYQLTVSISSSSPSIYICFNWSMRMTAGSRYCGMLRVETTILSRLSGP